LPQYFLYPIFFAGTPAQISSGRIDLLTTDPAATTAPFPIVTPLRTITLHPSQTLEPIFISFFIPG
jgi:hypothetical protein